MQVIRTQSLRRMVSTVTLIFFFLHSTLGFAGGELPVPSDNFVSGGSATVVIDHNNIGMRVLQSTNRAILNWESFNIGSDSFVRFEQPDASSIALNRIFDQSASQIFGSLEANGTVYLLNPNGILFGETASVNVGGLMASTLDIDDELFLQKDITRAITNDDPALFFEEDQTGKIELDEGLEFNAEMGKIVVQSGAELKSAKGGSIMMFAPEIINGGLIETPEGQTILAASHDKVYLTASDSDPDLRGLIVEVETGGEVSNIGEIIADRGNVTLLGLAVNQQGRISATTSVDLNGSIRLLARDSAQVDTTTISDGKAQALGFDSAQELPSGIPHFAIAERGGSLTLGEGSVTEVLPDDLTKTAIDQQAQPVSKIELMGQTIDIQKNSVIRANSGEVVIMATSTPDIPLKEGDEYKRTADISQVLIDEGAIIDVSGLKDVVLPMSRNIVELELRGNELSDAPLQREGVLRGETVTIDIRKGTPLADYEPTVGQIKRSLAERMTNGGRVIVHSDGGVAVNPGAKIDISGGNLKFETGRIKTTKLKLNGHFVDIADAQPDVIYDGIAIDSRPGDLELGYIEGKAAGNLFIGGHWVSLSGDVVAGSPIGIHQREIGDVAWLDWLNHPGEDGEHDINDFDMNAALDLFSLDGHNDIPYQGGLLVDLRRFPDAIQSVYLGENPALRSFNSIPEMVNITRPDYIVSEEEILGGLSLPFSTAEINRLGLPTFAYSAGQVEQSGVGLVEINSNREITVAEDASFNLKPLSSFSLFGAEIDWQGEIFNPGGLVSLETSAPFDAGDIVGQFAQGNFPIQIGENAAINVNGLWVNEYYKTVNAETLATPKVIDAGEVSINGEGHVDLEKGSSIRADGGAFIDRDGGLSAGRGGDINIATTRKGGSRLTLDGELSAFGLDQGGSLSITANRIQLGGNDSNETIFDLRSLPTDASPFDLLIRESRILSDSTEVDAEGNIVQNQALVTDEFLLFSDVLYDSSSPGANLQLQQELETLFRPLILEESFFAENGFSALSFKSNLFGIEVPDNQVLKFQQHNFFIDPDGPLRREFLSRVTGSDIADFSEIKLLPDYMRGSVDLTLELVRADAGLQPFSQGAVYIGQHSSLAFDPGAVVSVFSDRDIYVGGSIETKGGDLSLVITNEETLGVDSYQEQGIWLDDSAHIDLSATVIMEPNKLKLRQGTVLDAGSLTMVAEHGYVFAKSGAIIDISGTSSVFDQRVRVPFGLGSMTMAMPVAADAGTLDITAAEGILFESQLLTTADRALGAEGATLSFALDRSTREDLIGYRYDDTVISIFNENDMPESALDLLEFGQAFPTAILRPNLIDEINGKLNLSAGQIQGFDLDSLTLDVDNLQGVSNEVPRSFGRIELNGDFDISFVRQLTLDAVDITVNKGEVALLAPFIVLGEQSKGSTGNIFQQTESLRFDDNSLLLSGNSIDLVGSVAISGVERVELISEGDIRVRNVSAGGEARDLLPGYFKTAGDLELAASQIYPTSLSQYTFEIVNGEVSNPFQQQNFEDRRLTISPGQAETPFPLSAVGELNFSAPNIDVYGTVRAPLGKIHLDATEEVNLFDGAIVSVSAEGFQIPLGNVRGSGIDWIYPLFDEKPLVIQAPDKQIDITGRNVNLMEGSTVDVSGGGDIFAYEFIQGPGGSQDVLTSEFATAEGSFAIVPGVQAGYSIYDPLIFGNISDSQLPLGQSIILNDSAGLPAGEYTILPARYAMVPGAFLVRPTNNGSQVMPGESYLSDQGGTIVAGKFSIAHTDIEDSLWQSFEIFDGSFAFERSEYQVYSGNEFFGSKAAEAIAEDNSLLMPYLPRDAGALVFAELFNLDMDGEILNRSGAEGRGARLEVSGESIQVVRRKDEFSKHVQLLDDDLNAYQFESVLLGANRAMRSDVVTDFASSSETGLVVGAGKVEVLPGAELSAAEIILAANEQVTIGSDAIVRALSAPQPPTDLGATQAHDRTFSLSGDGALLRVSSADQVTVSRDVVDGVSGNLTIEDNALIVADMSVLTDATVTTHLNGIFEIEGGSLNLNSQRIALGNIDNPEGDALAVTQGFLNDLALSELVLSSRSSIDFYGDVEFTADDIVLSAGAMRGMERRFSGDGDVLLTANQTIVIDNHAANQENTVGLAAGDLTFSADIIQFGVTEKDNEFTGISDNLAALGITGFGNLHFNAGQAIIAEGTTAIKTDANVDLLTPIITGRSGAVLDIASDRSMRISSNVDTSNRELTSSNGDPADDSFDELGLGAVISLTADTIDHKGKIVARSGMVQLNARGNSLAGDSGVLGEDDLIDLSNLSGSLVVASGSEIDVRGVNREFGEETLTTDGGEIQLNAKRGHLIVEDHALLKLGATEQGGKAGSVIMSITEGELDFRGSLSAVQAVDGRSGEIAVEAYAIKDFSRLLTAIEEGGVRGTVDVRLGHGDIDVNQSLKAQQIKLTADTGSINVSSQLDSSGAEAGAIELFAQNDLIVGETATLLANATRRDELGGLVNLVTKMGKISVKDGSLIDVSSGERGIGGELRLNAPWQYLAPEDPIEGAAPVTLAIDPILGEVRGANEIVVEATRSYELEGELDLGTFEAAQQDAFTFMDSATEVVSALAATISTNLFTLVPNIDFWSRGDISVNETLDLSGYRFGENGTPGVLSLRAQQDILINQDISDGFVYVDNPAGGVFFFPGAPPFSIAKPHDLILNDESWSYRIVAGAAEQSSDYLAVNAEEIGNLILADNVTVRTGTGDIEMRASDDLIMSNEESVIYSAGNSQYTAYSIPSVGGQAPEESGTFFYPDLGTIHPNWIFSSEIPFGDIVYPENGGNINVSTGGNIIGSNSQQLFSQWLHRLGGEFGSGSNTNNLADRNLTTWAIAFNQFSQGIGAFGGGDININAGGSIENLSVVSPTTGRQVGSGIADSSNPDITNSVVEVIDSGAVSISANGDILSPRYLAGNGLFEVSSGGSIIADQRLVNGEGVVAPNALVGLGDAKVSLYALRDLVVETAFNPTAVVIAAEQSSPDPDVKVNIPISTRALNLTRTENYFFTYGSDAELAVTSLTGDITFNNDKQRVIDYSFLKLSELAGTRDVIRNAGLNIYPGIVSATALSESIKVNDFMDLFPSPVGGLELLAEQNITSEATAIEGGKIEIKVSDIDPENLPQLSNPTASYNSDVHGLLREAKEVDSILFHAQDILHLNDFNPSRLVARQGDITGETPLIFRIPENTLVSAGNSILNTGFRLQNSRASDITVIEAGKDIVYEASVNADTGELITNANIGIEIAGPGALQVIAGRDIILGGSAGIESTGNTTNANLPDVGSDVTLFAGSKAGIDYDAFYTAYLSEALLTDGKTFLEFAKSEFDCDCIESEIARMSGVEYVEGMDKERVLALYDALDQEQRFSILQKYGNNQADRFYSLELIDFVTSSKFAGDLAAAVSSSTGASYQNPEAAIVALNQLNVQQQHEIGLSALKQSSKATQRRFIVDVLNNEVLQGGIAGSDKASEGFSRGYDAIETLFPEGIDEVEGGDISLLFSTIRTFDDASMNFIVPHGGIDVGITGKFAGNAKDPGDLGIVMQLRGQLSAIVHDDINVNSSKIVSLSGGDVMLWSSEQDIDAGKGAKTDFTAPPPLIKFNESGQPTLEFPPAVAGNGIQLANNPNLIAEENEFCSSNESNVYLFAPRGIVDAGDAGISSAGNIRIAAQQVIGADNISVGGISVGVPTDTGISVGLGALGGLTAGATGAAEEGIESVGGEQDDSVAFLTVEVIGLGDDDDF